MPSAKLVLGPEEVVVAGAAVVGGVVLAGEVLPEAVVALDAEGEEAFLLPELLAVSMITMIAMKATRPRMKLRTRWRFLGAFGAALESVLESLAMAEGYHFFQAGAKDLWIANFPRGADLNGTELPH